MANTKELLTLVVEICDAMLRNGTEIYRVEETAVRILEAYNVESFDIYILANGIFASANENKEDACSMIRHVPLGPPHLGRVAALNQLVRELCAHECSIEDAWTRLDECRTIPFNPQRSRAFFCAVGCGGCTFLFGGAPTDILFSFLIGIVLELFSDLLAKQKTSRFISNIFSSALVTLLALVLIELNLPIHSDKVIIGDIMPLVPGIALTTSIRDFFNGDYLCGTIHLIDALLTAFCIAVGVGTVISLFNFIGGAFPL